MNNYSSTIKWILFVVLLGILYCTNPAQEKHADAVSKVVSKYLNKAVAKETDNVFVNILASLFVNPLIDSLSGYFISSDNYFLFSITKFQFRGQERSIGIGLLGRVSLFSGFENTIKELVEGNKKEIAPTTENKTRNEEQPTIKSVQQNKNLEYIDTVQSEQQLDDSVKVDPKWDKYKEQQSADTVVRKGLKKLDW